MKTADLSRYKVLPVQDLVKASWNYKTDDPALLEKLKANIKRNGQVENIIVRKLATGFYEVVNGNHRLDAITSLAIPEVVVFDLGIVSDAQARRIAVETNETKFETDHQKLAVVLGEILDDFPDMEEALSSLPYSPEDIENFNKILCFNWDEYAQDKTGADPQDDDKDAPSPIKEPVADEDNSGLLGRFVLEFRTDEERQFWLDLLSIDGSMYSYTVEQYRATHPQSPFEEGK